eukprot:5878550-Prymnesium_polylepis.1
MPKAAKVTHPPRRPLNCESEPTLKILLPPRGGAEEEGWSGGEREAAQHAKSTPRMRQMLGGDAFGPGGGLAVAW